ncbi:MAG TPA: hypothetical protein VGC62_16265 [Pseudomonas sp.]|uniref:hypothetical protein n=1 Tax=Pseudomonas sp. TaxID=306 RepID=UPI002ED938E5
MDHELIDRALTELSTVPSGKRTPELIQGWARFICAAAGAEVESETPMQRAQMELHAAVGMIATTLGPYTYRTYLSLNHDSDVRLSTFIFINDEITLMALGRTVDEVLGKLRQDAERFGIKEAA